MRLGSQTPPTENLYGLLKQDLFCPDVHLVAHPAVSTHGWAHGDKATVHRTQFDK